MNSGYLFTVSKMCSYQIGLHSSRILNRHCMPPCCLPIEYFHSSLNQRPKQMDSNTPSMSVFKTNFKPNAISLVFMRMAGHSKWQNIRHIKAANDQAKSKVANKAIICIRSAVKQGGGTNPDTNSVLAKAIKFAEVNQVPRKAIKEALQTNEIRGDTKEYSFGLKGFGDSMFVIVVDTHMKVAGVKSKLNFAKKKINGTLLDSGVVLHYFNKKGIILVEPGSGASLEDAEELAIEVGAEEVRLVEVDGVQHFKFISDEFEVNAVCESLDKQGCVVLDSCVGYIAKDASAVLTEEQKKLLPSLPYRLAENFPPEAFRIYDNLNHEGKDLYDK